MIVPTAVPVKLTVQTPWSLPMAVRVQLALVGDTLAPLAVTLNVPLGLQLEPQDVEVSVTVTVQLLACPALIGVGQLTDVVVLRLTSIEAFPELVACVLSPA